MCLPDWDWGRLIWGGTWAAYGLAWDILMGETVGVCVVFVCSSYHHYLFLK